MKTDLSKFDNSATYQHPPMLKRIVWHVFSSVFINTKMVWPVSLKKLVLKLFGMKMGQNLMIKPSVNIKYPWLVELGDHVWIGEQVWIDNFVRVKIGSNVCLSQGAMLLTGNHNYTLPTFDLITGSIVLEDGVWIGAKSLVGPGVTCRQESVLSVCSVATKDLDSFGIYRGNPAIFQKKREFKN